MKRAGSRLIERCWREYLSRHRAQVITIESAWYEIVGMNEEGPISRRSIRRRAIRDCRRKGKTHYVTPA